MKISIMSAAEIAHQFRVKGLRRVSEVRALGGVMVGNQCRFTLFGRLFAAYNSTVNGIEVVELDTTVAQSV